MAIVPHQLENAHWQVGILAQTGASIAYGRVKTALAVFDLLRPTDPADYGNSSRCASFIMLPWCNRIKGGVLRVPGSSYQLRTTKDDGTARHGDVRGRPWRVEGADADAIRLTFDSTTHADINFPFHFAAAANYRLDGRDFIMDLSITNTDTQPYPCGFGHHPYFVRAGQPEVTIPCGQYFELSEYMATGAPVPVTPAVDFRLARPLGAVERNDVLTGRIDDEPVRIRFGEVGVTLTLHADPIFAHWLLFAPAGQPFFAVEPMTNTSDGFSLFDEGVSGTGVFLLAPGATAAGSVTLRLER